MMLANRLARAVVLAVGPRDTSFTDAMRIAVMPSWFGIIACVYAAIAGIAGLPVVRLFGDGLTPAHVARGVALGVGEASVSMMLATAAYRLFAPLRHRQRGGDPALEYRTLGQGGWMRTYRHVLTHLPWLGGVALAGLPLLGEEIIFRATAIP